MQRQTPAKRSFSKQTKVPKLSKKVSNKKSLQTKGGRFFASISTKPIQQQQVSLFGAYGQTGPYVAQYLGPTGMRMIAAYRDDGHKIRKLKLVGEVGQVVPKFFDWKKQESLVDTMVGSDLVINMIGSNVPTMHFNEFDANLRTALQIAKTAKEQGVTRFIHVSAAGASPHADSKFLRAKWESEEAVKTYFPNATIVRPCFIYDQNNVYLHTLAASCDTNDPIVAFADTVIQPTYARDVGAAIAQLALHPEIDGQTWTLGGQEAMSRYEIFNRFNNMVAHKESILGDALQRVKRLDNNDSYRVFAKEQLLFANPINRATPVGECDYFASDVTLENCDKTKGFAELGIKPSDTNLTFVRIGKGYLTNLSKANKHKLFTWETGCIDQRALPGGNPTHFARYTLGTH
jgi:uncharacterized protein YbjT (DUF2867 family)